MNKLTKEEVADVIAAIQDRILNLSQGAEQGSEGELERLIEAKNKLNEEF